LAGSVGLVRGVDRGPAGAVVLAVVVTAYSLSVWERE
jgi:hypothetical protein